MLDCTEIVGRAVELLGQVMELQTKMQIQISRNEMECVHNACATMITVLKNEKQKPATSTQETQTKN